MTNGSGERKKGKEATQSRSKYPAYRCDLPHSVNLKLLQMEKTLEALLLLLWGPFIHAFTALCRLQAQGAILPLWNANTLHHPLLQQPHGQGRTSGWGRQRPPGPVPPTGLSETQRQQLNAAVLLVLVNMCSYFKFNNLHERKAGTSSSARSVVSGGGEGGGLHPTSVSASWS